jgi:nitrogen fixation NifU-like protein
MAGAPGAPGLQALYQEIILEHSRRPIGAGLQPPPADAAWAESYQVNPTCGDEVTVRVVVSNAPDGPRVRAVSHDGHGCSISRAAASVLSEVVSDLPVAASLDRYDEFHALVTGGQPADVDADVVAEHLGDGVAFAGVARYPMRVKCALLPWMALRDALRRWSEDEGGPR